MSLFTLISAIEYLENIDEMEKAGVQQLNNNLEEMATQIANPSHHFHQLDSTASGSVVTNQHLEKVTLVVKHEIDEETPTNSQSSSRNCCIPPVMSARQRKMHRISEKSRRAEMRGCLSDLNKLLPPGTPYEGTLSTSKTLLNSVKFIKQLEIKDRKLEKKKMRLLKIRTQLEENLKNLNSKAAGNRVDVEITSIVPSKAAPIQEEFLRPSLDISTIPVLNVEEVTTMTPEIPFMNLDDFFPTSGSRGCNDNPAQLPEFTSGPILPFGFSSSPAIVLRDNLRHGLPAVPPSYTFPVGRGASPHGYVYNDANNFERTTSTENFNSPSVYHCFPSPTGQFLFANRFPNNDGGGSRYIAFTPFNSFTGGLSGCGGNDCCNGCYGWF